MNESLKITIRFLTNEVRSDALNIKIFYKNCENLNKCIILTGAMIPIKFGSSDGLFNLGCAVGLVQSLKNGVYVAMNGNYFPANKVKKNIQSGLFEKV